VTGNIFQDIILRHSRAKTGSGRPDHYDVSAEEVNSLCGDRVTVFLVNAAGTVQVRFEAEGCSLCQASASVMCAEISGRTEGQGRDQVETFIRAFPQGQVPAHASQDVEALFDMRRFPAREKCVLLPWLALRKCFE
jgi:nitrogen fixation NifU-like protein